MGKIKGVKVVQGENSGELIVTLDKVKGADSYLSSYGRMSIINDSRKTIRTGKVNQFTITSIEPAKNTLCYWMSLY